MGRSLPSMCGDLLAWSPSHTISFFWCQLSINALLQYSLYQARDLEVNGGVWRGETTDVGYDTFPSGWGILQYNEADHLNRFLLSRCKVHEQGEVRRHNVCRSDGGFWKPLLERWVPLLRPGGTFLNLGYYCNIFHMPDALKVIYMSEGSLQLGFLKKKLGFCPDQKANSRNS